jgi:electron transport complex protein RnfD
MLNQLIALSILSLPPLLIYGVRTLIIIAVAVLGAVAAEAAWCLLTKQKQSVTDLSAVCSGIILACMMPPAIPLGLVLLGSAFGALTAKLPFGRLGRGVFHPAVTGFAFISAGYSPHFLVYPAAYGEDRAVLPIFSSLDLGEPAFENSNPIDILKHGLDPNLDAAEFLLAQMRGPLGTTAVLLLLCSLAWLIFKKSAAWQSSAAFAATVFTLSLFFRYDSVKFMLPIYDLLCGYTIFAAVFLMGDLLTAPQFVSARVIYGIAGGMLFLLLRRTGAVGGEIFAVMIISAFSASIDRLVWRCRLKGISFTGLRDSIAIKIERKFKMHNEEDEIYGTKI